MLHVQDLWPESVLGSGMAPAGRAGRALERGVAALMRATYRLAGAVVVISPAMADLVVARGADPDRVRVVWNWTDDALFRPVPATDEARAALGHRGRCTVMFAGNIGLLQGIETAIRAAAVVRDRIDLVLVGSGAGEEAAPATRRRPRRRQRAVPRPAARRNDGRAVRRSRLAAHLPARPARPARHRPVEAAGRVGLRLSRVIAVGGRRRARLVRSAGSVSPARRRTGGRSPTRSRRRPTRRPPAAAMGRRARQVYRDRMSLRVASISSRTC